MTPKDENKIIGQLSDKMVHDLRTSLTVINGSVDTILDEIVGPITADQKDLLETIKRNAKKFFSLIGDAVDDQRRKSMSLKKYKIFVVDDDPDFIKVTKINLSAKGHEVVTALNGWDALSKLKTYTPDVIVTDLVMTNMDGWKLGAKIREDARFKKIPIIF